MNTQSKNVQPPAGWTVQTYIDGTSNVQVGHTFSPVWPFSVYPPLPPGHPASLPPGLSHGPSQAAVTGPTQAPQKSPLPRSSNQSPAEPAVGLTPMYTPSTSSSHTPPASWSQPHAGNIYPPPFPPQWSSMYGGYYYPYIPPVQSSLYPPAALPPFSNGVANVPSTVQRHSSVSSKASKATTFPPPKDNASCHEQPTSVAALAATYEFTFKCSPQLDLQQCCSPQPVHEPHEHTHDSLPKDYGVDKPILPSSAPPLQNSELPLHDLDAFQGMVAALMNQEEPLLTQQGTSTLPYHTQPVQDDKAAAYLVWSLLTGQDAPVNIEHSTSPHLPPCPSPAPSTSSSQTQMSASTLVSTWSDAGSSSQTGSPPLPCALPPHQAMFSTSPPGQSTSGPQGKKRSIETEHSTHTAGTDTPKRRRLTTECSVDEPYWCTPSSDYVVVERQKLHTDGNRHSGKPMFSCRICHVLGIINRGHSRKDSLKRHITQQHKQQYGPIWETYPQILAPSLDGEDIGYLDFILASPLPQ